MKIFTLFLLIFSLFLSCSDNSTNSIDNYSSITLDEIYQSKITNYVDSLINLETKVYWENSNIINGEPNDSMYADLLRLKFENADNYISEERFRNQRRGDLFINSDHIYTKWDGKTENYYFNDDSLSNNKSTYVFLGKIKYRDWLNVTEENLKDSVFISESNNVVYWSQKFEFEVEEIIDKY